MKISSIPQFYRNVRRWTEILAVLSKYGLADWLSQLNIDFVKDQLKAPAGEALARQSRSARIRLALSELGPTFIKLGQLLSTRADLIGVDLAGELKSLQSISRHRLETNGAPTQDLCTDPTPLQSQIIKLFGISEINYGRKKCLLTRICG